jgi:serine/threonine-protein kinase RsbW
VSAPAVFSHDYPGCPEAVGEARAWVAGCLPGCPVADDVVLCLSEAASNAVCWSRSGAGGKFTVRVVMIADRVRVEVADQGGPGTPTVRDPAEGTEGGRGLAVIAALAAGWGVDGGQAGRCVWMEFTWPDADRAAWAHVMGRAGWRCQCTGQCGQDHARYSPADGRCLAAHPDGELHAVPAWPVSAVAAVRLPRAALVAMCAACHDRRDRRAARRQGAASPQGEDLFGQDVDR